MLDFFLPQNLSIKTKFCFTLEEIVSHHRLLRSDTITETKNGGGKRARKIIMFQKVDDHDLDPCGNSEKCSHSKCWLKVESTTFVNGLAIEEVIEKDQVDSKHFGLRA